MSVIRSFLTFIAGLAISFLATQTADGILATIGVIVAVLGLFMLAPHLFRIRVEIIDIKIKLMKTFWASSWFYYGVGFAILYWVAYLLPKNYQTWVRVSVATLLVLSILYSMSNRKTQRPS